MQSWVEDSKCLVYFSLIVHKSRDLAHTQCCMVFKIGRSANLADNSFYDDHSAT